MSGTPTKPETKHVDEQPPVTAEGADVEEEEHSSSTAHPPPPQPPLHHEEAAAAVAADQHDKQVTASSTTRVEEAVLQYCNSTAAVMQRLAVQYQTLVEELRRNNPQTSDIPSSSSSASSSQASTTAAATPNALPFGERMVPDIRDFHEDLYIRVGEGCVSIKSIGTVAHGLRKAQQATVQGELTKVGRGTYVLSVVHKPSTSDKKRAAPSSETAETKEDGGSDNVEVGVGGGGDDTDPKQPEKRETGSKPKRSKKAEKVVDDDIPEYLNVVPDTFRKMFPKCIVLTKEQTKAIMSVCKVGFSLQRPTSEIMKTYKEAEGNEKMTPFIYSILPGDARATLQFLTEVRKYFRSAEVDADYEKYSNGNKRLV
jgi:hypothetical protein